MAVYENSNDYASKGQGTAAVTLSAITTGLLALNGNGGLSGLFGGGNNTTLALAQKDAEIAMLKADNETDRKLVEVYNALFKNDKEQNAKIDGINARVLALETSAPLKEQLIDQKIARVTDSMTCCCNSANTAIANLQATIANITKVIVPATAVCPEPMPLKNSWTAPTT